MSGPKVGRRLEAHPDLDIITINELRNVQAADLREQEKPSIVVQRREPVAALVPYRLYVQWQTRLSLPIKDC